MLPRLTNLRKKTSMVNDALEKRRKQHIGIIKRTRIYILVTLILTLTNAAGIAVRFTLFSLPYSLTSVQAAFEYGVNMMRAEEGPSVIGMTVGLLIAGVVFALFAKCWFSMKESLLWTRITFILYSVELCVTIIFTIINFVFDLFIMSLYLIDIGIHIFVLVQLGRAKRSHYALTVLPDKETEENIEDIFKAYRAENEDHN